ncbi:MAG: 16S rRNA (guanine(527)-N(7))-methyltransferase RsmG [Ignavibacteriae bacterium]|nr:16S rRNA (guanine(527)-N(7))-methyltransferase RsmG [Ignavibacteriota bacterium]
MTKNKQIFFVKIFEKNNICVSNEQFEVLNLFASQLLEWNGKVNLISRKDEENLWEKHIFGSLLLISKLNFERHASIVDVGTGGGFPGIPLAICLPENQFTLVDSIQKKINAVNDIITQLGLTNVTAICSRAETLSETSEHKNRYDYIVSRAVARVNEIVRWSKNFLCKNQLETQNEKQKTVTTLRRNSIVMFKGGDISEEIRETEIKQKPKSIEVIPLNVNGLESFGFADKKLVIIRL